MEHMTVGGLAETAGVNIETVRFYENKGLLPKPERTSGGHRVYEEADVERLCFIQRAKEVGFTLKEITVLRQLREAGDDRSCAGVMELTKRKIEEIDGKLTLLTEMRKTLTEFYDSCPEDDIGTCHVLGGLSESVE